MCAGLCTTLLNVFRQERSFNVGVDNKGIRTRMHVEDHRDTPRDCVDLEVHQDPD